MPQVAPTARLLVCLIAQNWLADAYLRQVLNREQRIRTLALNQHIGLSPLQRKDTVFVVDQCGLEVPLSECLRRLRTSCQNARFLVLSDEKTTEQIVRLLTIGAHGYVPYFEISGRLARAVFSVAGNELWVPREAFLEFLREAASALRKEGHGRQTTTPREDQILELVRRRLSNREIAQLLQIRLSTVKFHVSNILSKMYARNRHDLVETPSEPLWKMLAS